MRAANTPVSPAQAPVLQLEDIHLPEQITNLPIAIGWWLLASLALIAIIVFIKRYQVNKQRCFNKNKALQQLKQNPALTAEQTISLMKWTAMQYFDRLVIANLYGNAFQHFLSEQLPQNQQAQFIELSNSGFALQYQKADSESSESNQISQADKQCRAAALLWLTSALPVNVKKTAKKVVDKNISGAPAHD